MSFWDTIKELFGGATEDAGKHVENLQDNVNLDDVQQKAQDVAQNVGEQVGQTAEQTGEKVDEIKNKFTDQK